MLQFLKIFTPNAKLGKICHLAKTAGMRNENSAFLSFYNPILRSWTICVISWKDQGPNAKLLAFFPNSHLYSKNFACFAHLSFCSHFDSKIEQTIKCELHSYQCESEFDSHKCEYSLALHQQINCITKCEIQSINANPYANINPIDFQYPQSYVWTQYAKSSIVQSPNQNHRTWFQH